MVCAVRQKSHIHTAWLGGFSYLAYYLLLINFYSLATPSLLPSHCQIVKPATFDNTLIHIVSKKLSSLPTVLLILNRTTLASFVRLWTHFNLFHVAPKSELLSPLNLFRSSPLLIQTHNIYWHFKSSTNLSATFFPPLSLNISWSCLLLEHHLHSPTESHASECGTVEGSCRGNG